MDLFANAKTIRLVTHTDKYLIAEDDRLTVSLARDGSGKNAIWAVEFIEDKNSIRFRSCFGTYLTASSIPFLPGVTTTKKVVKARSSFDSASSEWEPFRDGMQVRLRSAWGYFLRPNGGLLPWRNSVTHEIPFWSKTRDKILWDVEVVERWSGQRSFSRSRSVSAAMDDQKMQSENIRRMLLDNQIDNGIFSLRCCWYPKVNVSSVCSRKIL